MRDSTKANALMPSPTVVAAVGSSVGEVSGQCERMRSTIIVIPGRVHNMAPQRSLDQALRRRTVDKEGEGYLTYQLLVRTGNTRI